MALRRVAAPPGVRRRGRPRRRVDARDAVARRRLGRVRRGQHQELVRKLPFCDFGEVIDPPSADVTAHVVEMLAQRGWPGTRPRGAGSSGCCASRRRTAPGSAAGAATTSTARAPPCPRSSPPASRPSTSRSAAPSAGCEQVQNDDGGWGEDMRSYDDPAWSGRGAVDRVPDRVGAARAARRGRAGERGRARARLARPTRSWRTATWDEPWFTGHRFPRRLLHQLPPVPARLPGHARSAAYVAR